MLQSRCLLSLLLVLPSANVSADEQSSDHEVGLRENRPSVWALQHATVVVRPGEVLQNATLVVREGKIESVRSSGDVPPDAQALDLTGRTIYAGFIDAYSETELSADRLQDTPKYWNANVVPQLSVSDQLPSSSRNESLRKQGIVAQLRAPSTRVIRGQSALVSTGSASAGRAILADNVAQHLELTVARREREVYPGSPMGAVALARQAIYDAMWYRDAWNAARADATLPRPDLNDALAALQPILSGDQPVIAETSDEQFVLRAERFAGEFGLRLMVRGSGREYRRLDEIAATKRPVILPLNFPMAPNVSTAEVAENVTLESLMHWDLAPENPGRVARAGIRFAFCTDQLKTVDDFLNSLRKAVRRGLSQESALRALTQTPAELFDISDQLGALEAGMLASFVITDGDLFEDKTKVRETWVAGERFQHSPEPIQDLTGHFEIRLAQSGDYSSQYFLELKRDKEEKVSGRVSTKPFSEDPTPDSKQNDQQEQAASDETKDSQSEDGPVELKLAALVDFTATGQFKADQFGGEGTARLTLVFSNSGVSEESAAAALGQVVWPDGSVARASAFRISSTKETGPGHEESQKDEDSDQQGEDGDAGDADDVPEVKPASFAVNFPLGAFGRTGPADTAGPTAFMNATIWTCGPKGTIRRGTVLIDGGRIVAVGRKLKLPEGVRKIDVRGMHITPGIIDCHSHMATDGGVNESTQAVTCEVRIGDFIDADDISIYRQLAGGVTTSNILHGSANPIGGQNQVIKLRWGLTGERMKMKEAPPGVKFALGENVKQSNWGDDYTTRYPQTRMGVEQIFRDSFEAAREYAARWDAYQQSRRGLPPRRDLELDALREIIEQQRWIHCHSYRQDEILALIRVLDEYGITIGTFQHILEGYKVADEMARHGAMGSAFSDWWAYKFEVYDAIPYAGALMHKAGVVVSFNSDDAELATRLNQEAAKAVKYGGVSEEEALKFVTLNPARQLRIDPYVGSLEAGKQADLVVWNGPPLSNYTRCEQTWIDGALYFDRQQDEADRQEVFRMRNTLIQKVLTSGEKMRGVGEDDADPSAMWPRHDEFCHASGHDHVHDR